MMLPKTSTLTTILALGSSLAQAATMQPTHKKSATAVRKLIFSGPELVHTADFDGTNITITSQNVTLGAVASWMRYKPGTNLLYGNNENGNNLNLFTLNEDRTSTAFVTSAAGSSGVVFYEFTQDGKYMVAPAYGEGTVDIWDVSAVDGTPKLLKTITIEGSLGPGQESHHPHEAVLEPTGRFMLINDLGGDRVLVLDTQDAKFDIVNNFTLTAGFGPRHGGYIQTNGTTYYALACELASQLILFKLDYTDPTGLGLIKLSNQSTYGPYPPADPSTAAAGELQVASNNRDIYVSNRLTGNSTGDNIAHFKFDAKNGGELVFADMVSSYGILPRMFSLSLDETIVFVANQAGDTGILALSRDPETGTIAAGPLAAIPNEALIPPGMAGQSEIGPEFIQEIPVGK
ncbi:putative isomerase YbhE [Xylariaceae sp. FL0255]|nr:putative isomerase YbhE [Xylariaceae sp. FL0255]